MSIYDMTKDTFTGTISQDLDIAGLDDPFHICIENYVYISVYRNRSPSFSTLYIFTGNSNMGKSYISHRTSFSVYETDQSAFLPETFSCDIIIIGKKYPFDISIITEKIHVNIIHVYFEQLMN